MSMSLQAVSSNLYHCSMVEDSEKLVPALWGDSVYSVGIRKEIFYAIWQIFEFIMHRHVRTNRVYNNITKTVDSIKNINEQYQRDIHSYTEMINMRLKSQDYSHSEAVKIKEIKRRINEWRRWIHPVIKEKTGTVPSKLIKVFNKIKLAPLKTRFSNWLTEILLFSAIAHCESIVPLSTSLSTLWHVAPKIVLLLFKPASTVFIPINPE